MDYYTRKRAAAKLEQRRAQRIETIKQIITIAAALPVLWAITVLWLCI